MTPILKQISALDNERQTLWKRAGRGERLNSAEIARLRQIPYLLDTLWDERRRELAWLRRNTNRDRTWLATAKQAANWKLANRSHLHNTLQGEVSLYAGGE
jgi:hypothetical protein